MEPKDEAAYLSELSAKQAAGRIQTQLRECEGQASKTGLAWLASLSQSGFVFPVDPSDLKSAWTMVRETQARHGSNQSIAIGHEFFTRVCSPGADVFAVWYRVSMLGLLAERVDLLPPEMPSGVRDVVFNVAAKFPIKRMEPGVVK
jgi:hypothetical protein